MESESLLREENTEERFLDKFFKDSAFVVFIIPLYAFLITYCIEIGYAKYYGIPASVVQIDGRIVCNNFVKIMLIFIGLYGIEATLSNIFSKIFKKYKNKNLITRQSINYFFIEIIILILVSNVILCDIKNIFTIALILSLLLVTFSFIYNHKTQKRFEKRSDYEDLNKESEEIDSAMNLRLIGNFLGKKTLFFVFITFIFVSVSLTVGEFSAKNQTAFYKVNGRDDVVGIVIYGERIIAKGLSSDRIQNEIIFFDICNDTKIEILPLKSICKKSEENFEIHEQVINVSENNLDEDNP